MPVFSHHNLAAAMPGMSAAQRTYQIKKLVERKMLQLITKGRANTPLVSM